LDSKPHRFATYSGTYIESLQIFNEHVDWVLRNRTYRLHLNAFRAQGGALRGPTQLDRDQRLVEILNATVKVRLETLKGTLIFEGDSAHTGLEVIGDLPRLMQG
jgi:tocopherol cyclase